MWFSSSFNFSYILHRCLIRAVAWFSLFFHLRRAQYVRIQEPANNGEYPLPTKKMNSLVTLPYEGTESLVKMMLLMFFGHVLIFGMPSPSKFFNFVDRYSITCLKFIKSRVFSQVFDNKFFNSSGESAISGRWFENC